MKKSAIFFILIFCLASSLLGQGLGPAKIVPKDLTPLKECKDKDEFILKNFEVGNRRYVDVPLSVFLDELEKEYPFLFVIEHSEFSVTADFISRIIVLFYDNEEIKKRIAEGKEILGVSIFFYYNIYKDQPEFKAYEKAGLNKILKWNRRKYFDLLKDNIVDNCNAFDCSLLLQKFMKK